MSVFWLNLEQVQTCLEGAVTRLAEQCPEIEEVWLFGSLARGDAVPGSDADLFILLSQTQLSFLERSVHYQPDFCGVGVDILAYTRAELTHMGPEAETFLHQVQTEGLCLFRRASTS